MRYELEPFSTFSENLLFWMGSFVRWKINTLSNHQVRDKQVILECLQILKNPQKNFAAIKNVCKRCRSAGLVGINVFAVPLGKLYEYLMAMKLQNLTQIDEDLLMDFISVHTSNLSQASKKNYRIVLIGFFGFIDKHNRYKQGSQVFGIELAIRHLKSQALTKLPTYLNENELERMLDSIDNAPLEGKKFVRDKLAIKIIVYTGMRVSEVLNLRVKDLINHGEIWMFQIRGKGNKMRVGMIKREKIAAMMSEWMSYRGEISAKCKIEDDLIFCNQKGRKLTQSQIYQSLGSILGYAGIRKEKMGAHMLRHTFATMLYTKKHDLVLVQEALGHASLNTSRIYTHFDKQRLMEVANVMDGFK